MIFVARPDLDICVATIPKAGSSSISNAVLSNKKGINIDYSEAKNYTVRLAFIRHPVERFLSAFSFFWWHFEEGHSTPVFPAEDVFRNGCDYPAFVDYALSTFNDHWQPQSELLRDGDEMVPNVLHRFEDIQKHWEKYLKGHLPWMNAYSRLEVSDYRERDIKAFYSNDFDLWGGLNG